MENTTVIPMNNKGAMQRIAEALAALKQSQLPDMSNYGANIGGFAAPAGFEPMAMSANAKVAPLGSVAGMPMNIASNVNEYAGPQGPQWNDMQYQRFWDRQNAMY